MGCDIHIFTERKRGGKWLLTEILDIDRSYALFANLANVRNHDNMAKPICQPKGWPDDISNGGKDIREYWGDDAHSASYLYPSELKSHAFTCDGAQFELQRPLRSIADYYDDDDTRIVFCFDN